MPVHINEIDADVQVEGSAATTSSTPEHPQQLIEQWLEQQRRAQKLAARTAAFDFDD